MSEHDPRADPDVQLMLGVQAGDHAAFATLLRRNQGAVLGLAYRYLGDRAQAEDVAQDVFLQLYRARGRYRPDARFRSYLLRITANACLSRLRRRTHASLDAEDEAGRAGGDPADPAARAPGAALEQDELHARVRAAVAQLPDRQRLAILLNKFEGLGYREVGEQLGLSVPATKSLLHRARMALKDLLAPHVEGTS